MNQKESVDFSYAFFIILMRCGYNQGNGGTIPSVDLCVGLVCLCVGIERTVETLIPLCVTGKQTSELPESMQDLMMETTRQYYAHFKPTPVQ